MKIIILLFLNLTLPAKNTVLVDSLFEKVNLKTHLEYYHDNSKLETIHTIQDKTFSSYKGKNFPGLFAAKFWFKLNITNTTEEDLKLIYKVKGYAFYEKFKVYKASNNTITEVYNSSVVLKRKFDIPISLKKLENTNYYLEVEFTKSVFIPIKLITDKQDKKETIKEIALQSFYYGFSTIVLLINILFFIYTKNRFFLYYCIVQLGIVFSICFLDNLIYDLFGNSNITRYSNIFFNIMLAGGCILFTHTALDLKKHFRLFKPICTAIFILSLFFFSIHFYTGDVYWSGIGKICYLSILMICILTSAYCFKKSIYSRFFLTAFLVLYTCHILFIIPVLFGLKDLGFTEWHYKIGSAIEMIIFLVAIPYRHKSIHEEKNAVLDNLEHFKNRLTTIEQKKKASTKEKITKFKDIYKLTEREVEVLNKLLKGQSNKKIAKSLFLTESTINYMKKLR